MKARRPIAGVYPVDRCAREKGKGRSMTGLEKIVGRILSDAQAEADEILAKAEQTGKDVRRSYEQKAAAEAEKREAATEREATAILERARSSAGMMQENARMTVRSALLDEV